jgi:cell fate (sporulation/competence/biofilm development) regulator YlbF (YheA/YmcA/DUF963 family)
MLMQTKQVQKAVDDFHKCYIAFEEIARSSRKEYDNRSEKWQESKDGINKEVDIFTLNQLVSKLEQCAKEIQYLIK